VDTAEVSVAVLTGDASKEMFQAEAYSIIPRNQGIFGHEIISLVDGIGHGLTPGEEGGSPRNRGWP